MRPFFSIYLVAGLALVVSSAQLAAHEFWIDPKLTQSGAGAEMSANLRVGENLVGAPLPFLDTTVKSMTLFSPSNAEPLTARIGDRPAINPTVLGERGLHALTVETHPAYIVFDSFPEFVDYLNYEGLSPVADLHRDRGLPPEGIAEEYLRNARSLIQVGAPSATDADQHTGMAFEITIDGSPFLPGQDTVRAQVTWQEKAAVDVQVALYHLPGDQTVPQDATRILLRSDAAGYIEFPLFGAGGYLLNAVHMAPADGPGSVVWQSHWASLTFQLDNQ